ncbi:MAG: DNA mismatch repair endonuclease MutL [Lachnospiraceae bacterium]|nr:DNA mismatch repair endonuclease MutL [Lachnospiraceae bacterium]
MAVIHLLDDHTIDQIAAGEVVERPSSVVKELVENAMDAGASAITVEIKDGGIELIRVTDNGCGIMKEDIPNAFLRHATSKIRSADDLHEIHSMGFRGEALGSIAAVSKVELISKYRDSLMGSRYIIEGGSAKNPEEIGAPDGTTILVRNLFYNTPARRKFLKTAATEGSYIADLMEHLALSRPDISYTFIQNNQVKFTTSGNSDLKEVIYRIYGRDTSREIIPIISEQDGVTIEGYLGTPVNTRSNRNFENYFINQRYIKSKIITKGLEEGYRDYLMQHRFPFCVLHITMDTKEVDVNVHPTKMEVRFHDDQKFLELITKAVADTLSKKEMIADCNLVPETDVKEVIKKTPEPFEVMRREDTPVSSVVEKRKASVSEEFCFEDNVITENKVQSLNAPESIPLLSKILNSSETSGTISDIQHNVIKEKDHIMVERPKQLELFDEQRVLSEQSREKYRIIGQIFDTYWLFELEDQLYFLDQHAAHEKVNYERLMRQVRENNVYKQQLDPPIIISVTGQERQMLINMMEYFESIGFEIEEFGGNEYAIRTIPLELYQNHPKEMFLDILNELSETGINGTPDIICQRVATMACKASVKGNMKLSLSEINVLLDELLTLENPYHCPHGRPTIFSMSKYEIEKKFKRII